MKKKDFVELITNIVALIKDQEHGDALTPEQRVQKRMRIYQLADLIGEDLESNDQR